MLALHTLTSSDKSLRLSPKSFLLAFGIGLLISLGNFGIIKAYSLGAPQSTFTAFFYVTLIVYGLILGIVAWHEKFNLLQVLGVVLAIIGLLIVFRFKK